MAYFQLGDQQFPLKSGSQRVGPDGTGAEIRLPSGSPTATAVVTVAANQSVIIRRESTSEEIRVNGMVLGEEGSPLIHGDRVQIGGHDLRFGDTTQAGSTMFVSAGDIAAIVQARQGGPKKPTTATGGRLVSLVDGREYAVPAAGLIIGRDPAVDVVVGATEVSRRHTSIAPANDGYLLTDLSTNGVFVNGTRVDKSQVLGRGDVIKVGNEEFRFYADAAKAPTPAPPAHPTPPAGAPVQPAPPAGQPAPHAAAPASKPFVSPPPAPPASPPKAAAPAAPPTSQKPPQPAAPRPVSSPAAPSAPPPPPAQAAPAPAAPAPAAPAPVASALQPSSPSPQPPSPAPEPKPAPASVVAPAAPPEVAAPRPPAPSRAPFATLEVTNEGADKGKKFDVYSPLTNIGRGAHNDLVLLNESVSDSHAKLQKRESGWYIVDVDSTNGTYVGGRRVSGEQALSGAPDLRFGDVKIAFHPAREAVEDGKSTRAIVGVTVDEARRQMARKAAAPANTAPAEKSASPVPVPSLEPAPTPSGKSSAMIWVLLALVGVAAIVGILMMRGG